ncbi:MAG: amidohydrolase [Spirochaetales bacterium]|nr:amidohydrolase [Spirochaetales bacterium]
MPLYTILDGDDNYIFPMLHNGHTHSPMVLFRGYGDDMGLESWLKNRIWPAEARLSEEDYFWGNRLALLEMIKNGTGFFNEMYMNPRSMVRALDDLPLKALINYPVIDGMDEDRAKVQIRDCSQFIEETNWSARLKGGIALHSVYANSEYSLKWAGKYARERKVPLHIHLAETEQEVFNCRRNHRGRSPVEYLDSLDFFKDNRVYAAHSLWMNERDMEIMGDNDVVAVHNPVSNMKVAAGAFFPYEKLKDKGIPIVIGSDGAASNNNLDLLEEMKIAALMQKHHSGNPGLMTAEEAFSLGSGDIPAGIFGTGTGRIEVGSDADFIIINRKSPSMVPSFNRTSNLVYSASGSDVLHLICGGKVLMENRVVEGEDVILSNARARAEALLT